MYAALDTADRIAWSSGDPFQYVRNTTEKPYLAERGISMYTMQRAYFESRLYDEAHWKRYFDTLAADRINNFVVIFGYENGGFMAPLYPYFFDVKEFPDVEMVGLTKPQQARNTAAFQTMIRLAHERGIEVTAGIWDHIYRGGVQGGGIPGASQNAGKRVPGLVWGVTAENLAPYNKAALRRFLEVFPEIDAIQFRMHDEIGLKPAEIQPFWHDVFSDIKQTHPNLRLDLRAKGLPDAVIDDALESRPSRPRSAPSIGWSRWASPSIPRTSIPRTSATAGTATPTCCAIRSATACTGNCGAAAPPACCSGATPTTCAASPPPRACTMATASRSTKCSPRKCSANRTTKSRSKSSTPPTVSTITSSSATGSSTACGAA